jgi:hypothetical protein
MIGARARRQRRTPCLPISRIAFVLVALLPFVLVPERAHARPHDPEHPWFVEGLIGGVQPGPDGTDIGNGQDYGFALGVQWHRQADVAAVLGWANARETSTATQTDILSVGVRGRGWVGTGQWSGYGEASLRLYRVSVDVPPLNETNGNVGGELGAGVQYSRSTWWLAAGASVHGVIGSVDLIGGSGDLFTYVSYHVSVGKPIGW